MAAYANTFAKCDGSITGGFDRVSGGICKVLWVVSISPSPLRRPPAIWA